MNDKEPKLFYGDPRPNQKKSTFHVNKMGTGHDQVLDQKKKKKKKRHLEQLKVLRLEPEQAVKDFLDLKMCKILIKLLDQI